MERARRPDAAPAAPSLFLLDAGALRGPGAAAATCTRLWTPPAHHLDTPERLLACYQLICARRPEARVLVFLEGGGYSRLCLEWQGGACRALEPSAAQCVPFGCRVGDFLLEFARRKAAEGCEVVVVSNVADIVMECRSAGPRISHVGFMFVEGEILLPGLSVAPRAGGQAAEAAPAVVVVAEQPDAPIAAARPLGHAERFPPVRRTISKSGSGGLSALSRRRQLPGGCSSARGPPPPLGVGRARAAAAAASAGAAARAEVEYAEEREETLRDSQLDGVALEDDVADTLVDEADDAFADTVVDLPYREAEPLYDEAFADTLVDVAGDAPMATSSAAGSADGGLPGRLEDAAPAVAPPEDVPMAPAAEAAAVAVAAAPAELPPLAFEDGDYEVDGEPEHQSQLPEVQSPSSPEMEVEVEEHPSSPQRAPAAAAAPSQPRGDGSQASQTIVMRPAAGAEGLSQTIEIDAGARPAAPAGPSRPDPADAGAGLARQATTTVLLPETPAAPAEPALEPAADASARGEAAAAEAAEAATAPMEVEVATAPAAPAPAAAAAATPCAAAAAASAPAHGSQGPSGTAEGGARRPAQAQEEAVVEVAGSIDTPALAASQAATLPARSSQAVREERQIPTSALLGRWVRDGGREHTVVWTPGPAGSFLEFRPVEPNKKSLPILPEGGSWVLNGFHLDASRISSGVLHWSNRATGAERSWRRPEAASGDGGGAAAAVAALAGSFAGEAGR